MKVFQNLDTHGDGTLSLEEMRRATGSGLTLEQAVALYEQLDVDGDEEVTTKEFAAIYKRENVAFANATCLED